MPTCPASRPGRRAVCTTMLRRTFLFVGGLAGLLAAGCRTASRTPTHKEAVRTNAISNKRILTEQPILERPVPRVAPDSAATAP